MKFKTTLRLAALLGVFAFAGTAQAQVATCNADSTTNAPGKTASAGAPNCGLTSSASAVVKHILQLKLSDSTTDIGNVDMPQFDQSDTATTNAGHPFTLGPAIEARGNRPFDVLVRAAGDWAFTTDGYGLTRGTAKSAGDFFFRVETDGTVTPSTGAFTAMSTTDATAFSATTGGLEKRQMQYRTKWAYGSDVPGNYSLSLVYTIIGN